jgi:uncharacterized protein (DUF433 family)
LILLEYEVDNGVPAMQGGAMSSALASTVDYPFIFVDSAGVAWLRNTQTKVREIVLDKLVHGWSPEETARQHPHLSLGSIYSALAYYADHEAEIHREIEDDLARVGQLQNRLPTSGLIARLRNRASQG